MSTHRLPMNKCIVNLGEGLLPFRETCAPKDQGTWNKNVQKTVRFFQFQCRGM